MKGGKGKDNTRDMREADEHKLARERMKGDDVHRTRGWRHETQAEEEEAKAYANPGAESFFPLPFTSFKSSSGGEGTSCS